uniref:Uncharacterized protein n=1 Tax=Molossus molossus TaxID=27622 RepID=A0A7J8GQI7_MOLMO|nr:hypothetical protein HJG59_011232 [Molossus molossus]
MYRRQPIDVSYIDVILFPSLLSTLRINGKPGWCGSVFESRPMHQEVTGLILSVRAHAQVVGLIPSGGHAGGGQSMFSSMFLPLPLLHLSKIKKKKISGKISSGEDYHKVKKNWKELDIVKECGLSRARTHGTF